MLDQQDRGAVAPDVFEQRLQCLRFGGVHPGSRLIEGKQLGFGRERPRNLEAPLVAIGEVSRLRVGSLRDADVVEQLVGPLFDRGFLGQRRLVAQDRTEHAGVRAHVTTDHHVFQRRQVLEQPDVLERAGDAALRDLVRLQPV